MRIGRWEYIGAYNTIGNWRWWVVIIPVIMIFIFIAVPQMILEKLGYADKVTHFLGKVGFELMVPITEWTFKHRQL